MSRKTQSKARIIAQELIEEYKDMIPKPACDLRAKDASVGCVRRHLNLRGWYLDINRTGYFFNATKLEERKKRLGNAPILNTASSDKHKRIPAAGEGTRMDSSLYKHDGLQNPIAEAKKLGFTIESNDTRIGTEFTIYKNGKLLSATYSITEALRKCGIDGYKR
jgi:hypothetical protein